MYGKSEGPGTSLSKPKDRPRRDYSEPNGNRVESTKMINDTIKYQEERAQRIRAMNERSWMAASRITSQTPENVMKVYNQEKKYVEGQNIRDVNEYLKSCRKN
jgi:hypothetical protein